jgi:hypothetical protein
LSTKNTIQSIINTLLKLQVWQKPERRIHFKKSVRWRKILVASLATGWTIWSACPPKLSISTGSPLSTRNPLTTQVSIKNDGFFGVDHAEVSCAIGLIAGQSARHLVYQPNWLRPKFAYGAELRLDRDAVSIGRGENITLYDYCPINPTSDVGYADVLLVLRFRYASIFPVTKKYRLVTAPGETGSVLMLEPYA